MLLKVRSNFAQSISTWCICMTNISVCFIHVMVLFGIFIPQNNLIHQNVSGHTKVTLHRHSEFHIFNILAKSGTNFVAKDAAKMWNSWISGHPGKWICWPECFDYSVVSFHPSSICIRGALWSASIFSLHWCDLHVVCTILWAFLTFVCPSFRYGCTSWISWNWVLLSLFVLILITR